jgi:hypothetical protein
VRAPRRPVATALAALATAAVTLGATACGGSDAPSKAEYAKQADAICAPALVQLRRVAARLQQVAAGNDPAVIFRDTAREVRRSLTTSRQVTDRLDALAVPGGKDADRAKDWVAAQRRQIDLTDQLAAAFEARDERRVSQLSERIDVLNESNNRVARSFGMKACAEDV